MSSSRSSIATVPKDRRLLRRRSTILRVPCCLRKSQNDVCLICCAKRGKEQELIKQIDAVSVKQADEDGRTLVHWAALRGFVSAIKVAQEFGADLNARDNSNLETPMMLCLRKWSGKDHSTVYESVETLLNLSACVDIQNEEGHTVLHMAACSGLADVVSLLLKHGANKDILDKCGNPVITWPMKQLLEGVKHVNDKEAYNRIVCMLLDKGLPASQERIMYVLLSSLIGQVKMGNLSNLETIKILNSHDIVLTRNEKLKHRLSRGASFQDQPMVSGTA